MNKNQETDVALYFVIRRAFRCGSVSRKDLIKATKVSTSTATRIMSTALKCYSNIIERHGYSIKPKPLAKCPIFANEVDLLEHLDKGKKDALYTGFFENELPVTYVTWTRSMPASPGILETIVTAIRMEKQIDIIYLGIRLNEQPKKRKILPLRLEKMSDQWRVIAHDLGSDTFQIKVYVLSRILQATKSDSIVRIPFVQGADDREVELKIYLDHRFTSLQKEVLEHELKIVKNKVKIKERSLHEFKRRFTNAVTSKNVIWPPLISEE